MDNNKIAIMINSAFSLVTEFSNYTYCVAWDDSAMEPTVVWKWEYKKIA